MFEILGAKEGPCPLCTGKNSKDKKLFAVSGPYAGEICPDHLFVLVQQQPKEERRPLFEKSA